MLRFRGPSKSSSASTFNGFEQKIILRRNEQVLEKGVLPPAQNGVTRRSLIKRQNRKVRENNPWYEFP